MKDKLYKHIKNNGSRTKFACLLDPDKHSLEDLVWRAIQAQKNNIDYLFIGGSHLELNDVQEKVDALKEHVQLPLVFFPGINTPIPKRLDAFLLLSLISGRNAELLIGKHVEHSLQLRESKNELISCGYMLFETDYLTSAHYLSQSLPLPKAKPQLAAATALAGEQLGLKLLYMDAGSGANSPVGLDNIKAVKSVCSIPLIVGGGVRTKEHILELINADVDIVVLGTIFEENIDKLEEFASIFEGSKSVQLD